MTSDDDNDQMMIMVVICDDLQWVMTFSDDDQGQWWCHDFYWLVFLIFKTEILQKTWKYYFYLENLQYHIENHQYFVGDNIGETEDFVFEPPINQKGR